MRRKREVVEKPVVQLGMTYFCREVDMSGIERWERRGGWNSCSEKSADKLDEVWSNKYFFSKDFSFLVTPFEQVGQHPHQQEHGQSPLFGEHVSLIDPIPNHT